LFITLDDLDWGSLGVYGSKIPDITPNIDRLAAEGIRFDHAHVTIAICQPTRAVWMTGRYPHRSGALGFDPILEDVPTLPETLRNNGYFTGILSKPQHVVPTRPQAWDVVVRSDELKTGRDPELFYQHAQRFFEQAKSSGKPFFIMANVEDPHRPFAGSAQEEQWKEREPSSEFPGATRVYRPEEITVPGFLPDIPGVRQELSEYFSSVHRADETVGKILLALEEAEVAQNTLVMLASDNGIALPFSKTNVWRDSTRTPWIVRWPGVVDAGAHDRVHLISGVDFAPTVLDATGVDPLSGMDGRSFIPVLHGDSRGAREAVFTYMYRTIRLDDYPMRSVQDARYGYIYNAWADGKTVFKNNAQSGLTMDAMKEAAATDEAIAARVHHFLYRTAEEFYDYEADPHALHNLIDDPEMQDPIGRYRELLLAHMEQTDDPLRDAFSIIVTGRKK
jgi:N-sulfoglucosamine sulfohydrolase